MFSHSKKTSGAFTLIELLIVVAIIAILAAIAVPNFLEAQTRAKVSKVKADMRSLATALESYYVDHNNYVLSCTNNRHNGYEEFEGFTAAFRLGDVDYGYVDKISRATGGAVDLTDSLTGGFFLMLSTPIAYFGNPYVQDPFIAETNDVEGYIRYNAFNKHRMIGWEGYDSYENDGSLRHTRGTPADQEKYSADENPQISWWYLWSVGPDAEQGGFVNHLGTIKFWDAPRDYGGLRFNNNSPKYDPDSIYECMAQMIYDPTNGAKSMGNIYRLGGGRPNPNIDAKPSEPEPRQKYDPFGAGHYIYGALLDLTD